MAQTTSLVFNGGVIPSPSPVPAGSGKAKLLKIGEITITEQEVQVTKKVICDPDSVTTVAPFMEVITSARLAELISANSILVLDDGTVQYLMADATVVVEDGTSVCTSVNFLGLSLEDRAKVLYPCTRITDELTLQQVLEVGEPVETGFDLVKAYPEDTEAGTLIDKLMVEDTVQGPDDQTLLEILPSEDGEGHAKVAIDENRLRETILGIDDTLDGIIGTLDEMDFDSVPRAYLNSTLNQSPGDSVTTRTTIDVFSVNSIEGDCFEFEQTTTIDDTPFGYVWIEPGTYLINAAVTLQWVGNPRGTFIAKVGSVMGENFDFSQEQEIKRNTTKVVTIPNRMKLAVNITYDAGTPVMGFWIQSIQVVKLAGGMSQTNIVHDDTLVGQGSVADPLGVDEEKVAQSTLAGNLAPDFDPMRTASTKYLAGELVIANGGLHVFTADHYGAWTDSDATPINMSDKLFAVAPGGFNGTTLESCKEYGVYPIPGTAISSITDLPSNYGVGASVLIVLPGETNYGFNVQILCKVTGERTFKRFSPAKRSPQTSVEAWIETTSPLVFHGEIVDRLGYSSIEQCKKLGFYNCLYSHLANLSDVPSGFGYASFTLEVLPNSDVYNLQILIRSDGTRYTRRSPVEGRNDTPEAWKTDASPLAYYGEIVTELGYTSITQCKQYGVYNALSTSISSITDMPSNYGQARSFTLQVLPSNDIYNLQILQTLNNREFRRYSPKNSGTASDWTEINPQSTVAKVRLATLGDSITQGWWSDDNGVLHLPIAGKTWADYVATLNGWDVTNFGLGGSGYVHKATVNPQRDATEVVDNTDFSNFDIVSLAFGVNDWHYECSIGDILTSTLHDGTMVGNMRYCIETILSQNPRIKIVVILPFNSSAYGGNFASNWGLGSSLPTSGTLQNVIDKIKSVCDYYNIQCIDSINMNIVNRYNIEDVLGDGLHPKLDCYLQIARCFAKQMMF